MCNGKKISTIDLLSHTAGLSVHGFDGYKWDQPLPTLIQILNGEKPANSPPVRSLFEPRLRFQYSGGGYEVSELMLEDITGLPYVTFMRRKIFDPLGMMNTFYQSSLPAPYEDAATAYRFDGQEIGCSYHIYAENACGASLLSTPTGRPIEKPGTITSHTLKAIRNWKVLILPSLQKATLRSATA